MAYILARGILKKDEFDIQRFLRSLRGTGTGRHRGQPAPTCLDRHQSRAGPCRVSYGLCRCLTIDIDRHGPLETRYGPAQTGSKQVGVGPVPV